MFCDKCGTKVNDNDIYCPNCSAKLKSNTENNSVSFTDNVRKYKGKTIAIGVVAVVVLCGIVFYNSAIGKYLIAGSFANRENYNAAYSMVAQINGEKAESKKNYYKYMMDINRFIDNTDNSVDDLYNIINVQENLQIDTSFLSKNETDIFDSIVYGVIEDYQNNQHKFEEFETSLENACYVFSISDMMSSGESFSPAEIYEEIKTCRSNFENADTIYKSFFPDDGHYDIRTRGGTSQEVMGADYVGGQPDFYGSESIEDAINGMSVEMERLIKKYGEDEDGIYYKTFSGYQSPYTNDENDIDSITDQLKIIYMRDLLTDSLIASDE